MPKRSIKRRGGRRRRQGGMTFGASASPPASPGLGARAQSGVKDVAREAKGAVTGVFDKFTNLFKEDKDKTSAPIFSTGGRKSRTRRSRRGGKSRTRRSRRGGKSRTVRRSRRGGKRRTVRRSRRGGKSRTVRRSRRGGKRRKVRRSRR